MAESKCPKCGKTIARLQLSAMQASIEGQKKDYPAVLFSCPACKTALGAQIDPVAVMSGTVKGIAKALKGGAKS